MGARLGRVVGPLLTVVTLLSACEGERASVHPVTTTDVVGVRADERGAPDDAAVTAPASTTSTSASTTTATTAPPSPTAVASGPTGGAVQVLRVIDGDTFDLADGRRVRLAQVDAPERGACFASESMAALRRHVDGRSVALRRPPDGPPTDRYGRTLADVLVEGRSVNEALVREGSAGWYEDFADEDADLARRLAAAEAEARRAGRGLWSACAGASTAAASTTTRAPSSTRVTATTAAPAGRCHPAYPDECIPPPPPDLDCPDIGHKVRVDHAYGDPHHLDADGDGWGCQSYG